MPYSIDHEGRHAIWKNSYSMTCRDRTGYTVPRAARYNGLYNACRTTSRLINNMVCAKMVDVNKGSAVRLLDMPIVTRYIAPYVVQKIRLPSHMNRVEYWRRGGSN